MLVILFVSRSVGNARQIREWLGDTPCVMMIDELNRINELEKKDSALSSEVAVFLKEVFLQRQYRCLVYSSHTVATIGRFACHRDTKVSRRVIIVRLPVVVE
jgi:hypothetical protein